MAMDDKSTAALFEAIEQGYLTIVAALFKHHGNECLNARKEGVSNTNTPLTVAAAYGHADIVNFLIEKGANINESDNEEVTPLIATAIFGHDNIAEILINAGADIDARDIQGSTALCYAAVFNRLSMAEALLKANADSGLGCEGSDKPHTPVYLCTGEKNTQMLRLLTSYHAKVEEGDIVYAVSMGNAECIRMLVDYSPGALKANPAHAVIAFAASTPGDDKHVASTLQLLVDHGADVNCLNWSGYTPLHLAACTGYAPIIEALVDAGANPFALGPNGETVTDYAKAHYKADKKHDRIEPAALEAFIKELSASRSVRLAAKISKNGNEKPITVRPLRLRMTR